MPVVFMGQTYADDTERVYSSGVDITEDDLRRLAALPRLCALNLNTTHTTDAMLAIIGGLRGIEDLDVSLTNITDDGVPHLAALPHLRHLRIKENAIGDRGIAALAVHQELETLNVKALAIGDPSIEVIGGFRRLERVVFSRQTFSDAALARLLDRLPACEVIIDGQVVERPTALD